MSDGRNPKPSENFEETGPDFSDPAESKPEDLQSPEQIFTKRKAEVLKRDNEAFSQYLGEKQARDQQQLPQLADPPQRKPLNFNRRSVLTWGAGAMVVGEGGDARLQDGDARRHPATGAAARRSHLYRSPAPH